MNEYRIRTKIDDEMGSPSFKLRLTRQGLLTEKAGVFTPAGFGYMIFGNQPMDIIPQAGLLGTICCPDGKEETRDFNNPLILIPTLVEKWLKGRLPVILDRSQMVSEELIGNFPFVLIREAVVNALIHRDYDIIGAKCHIIVT